MAPRVPTEIVGRILAALYFGQGAVRHNPNVLLPVALVSATFRAEVERLIYSHIHLKTPIQVVKCFTTLQKRPILARYTRGLSIVLPLNSTEAFALWEVLGAGAQNPQARERKNRYLGRVMGPFGSLVTRTLHNLTNLQDYSLSLGGQPGRTELVFGQMWLPPNAGFKLQRFIVDLNLSPMMIDFLKSQPSIVDLLAPWFQSQRGTLPRTALPNVKSILTTSSMAASLVPGRPVRRVAVKDGSRMQQGLLPILECLPELAKASVAVRAFDAAVHNMTSVSDTLLEPLYAHLPSVDAITFRRTFLTNDDVYALYLSDIFSQRLSAFSKLRVVVLPAPHPLKHLREAGLAPSLGMFAGLSQFVANVQAQIVPANGGAPFNVNLGNLGDNLANAILGGQQIPAGQPAAPTHIPAQGLQMAAPVLPAVGLDHVTIPPLIETDALELPEEADVVMEVVDFVEIPQLPPQPQPQPPVVQPDGGAAPPVQGAFNVQGLPPFLQQLMNAPGVVAVNVPLQAGVPHWQPQLPQAPPAPVVFGPPPPPPAQPAPLNVQGLPPFLQQLMNNPNVTVQVQNGGGPATPGLPHPLNLANPAAQPVNGAAPPAPPQWNFGGALVVQGTLVLPPLPHVGQPPVTIAAAQNPAVHLGPVPAPLPAVPLPMPINVPAPANPAPANIEALGEQIHNTTNAIMNMIAASQANVNHLQQELLQTQVELAQVQQNLETLEDVALGAAGVLQNQDGPGFVLPPLPFPPHNLNAPAATGDGAAAGARRHVRDDSEADAKETEVLNQGQRSLKERELTILEKWKLGGLLPRLKTVMFDMDHRRRTIWTWKGARPAADMSRDAADSDNDDNDANLGSAHGYWEVEYIVRS